MHKHTVALGGVDGNAITIHLLMLKLNLTDHLTNVMLQKFPREV